MKYQAQTLEAPKAVATKGKPRKRGNSDALWGFTFLLPQLIGLLLFSIIPLISVFYLSMASWNGLGPITFVGLQNFIDQFQSSDLHIALLNTLAYTAIAVPGGLFLALLIALGLNNVRGKTVYRVLYFMPFITGSVAVGVIWAFLLNSDFGLFNSLLRSVFHAKGVGWLTDARFVIPSIQAPQTESVVTDGNDPAHARYLLDARNVGYSLPPAEGFAAGLSDDIRTALDPVWLQGKDVNAALSGIVTMANPRIQKAQQSIQ